MVMRACAGRAGRGAFCSASLQRPVRSFSVSKPTFQSLRFKEKHCWVEHQDNVVIVGINSSGQELLSRNSVEMILPDIGEKLEHGEIFAIISTDDQMDHQLPSPVDGTVHAVNKSIESSPSLLVNFPPSDAWLIKAYVGEDQPVARQDDAQSTDSPAQATPEQLWGMLEPLTTDDRRMVVDISNARRGRLVEGWGKHIKYAMRRTEKELFLNYRDPRPLDGQTQQATMAVNQFEGIKAGIEHLSMAPGDKVRIEDLMLVPLSSDLKPLVGVCGTLVSKPGIRVNVRDLKAPAVVDFGEHGKVQVPAITLRLWIRNAWERIHEALIHKA